MKAYETLETPLGRFTIVVTEDDVVEAAAFGELQDIRHLIGPGDVVEDESRTAPARRQLAEYFDGSRSQFDLALAEPATEFQRRYRHEMASLPYGATTSYGALARKLDSSARATGRANATNPLCIIVPCHRVIGADGSLTGYAYGVEIKRRLLEHEGAPAQAPLLDQVARTAPVSSATSLPIGT